MALSTQSGFAQYTKGLQKSLAATAPTNTAKPNKLVSNFQKRTQEAFDSMPDQINAQTAAEEAERLAQQSGQAGQASGALGAEENTSRAQQNVANTPEQINAPQSVDNQTRPQDNGGLAAIGQIGKAATNAQNMNFASRRPPAATGGVEGGVPGAEYGGGDIAGLSAEQAQNANAIANEGRRRGMNEADIQTAIMTSLAESGLRNINYGDRDSVGLFQQRTSQGWGSVDQIMNPAYSAGKFYEGLNKVNRNQTPWMQAQSVQRSAFADGSNYRAQFEKAQQITQSIVAAPVMGYNGSAQWINTHTNWYGDYDGQYFMQCVDLYNFYTSGFVGGSPMMNRVRGATDIWQNYDPKSYVQLSKQSKPQMGDVAVFNKGGGFDPNYGHVGIVAQYNANGTIRVLNANATSAGPKANTTMNNFSTSNLIGYLRPRKLMGA